MKVVSRTASCNNCGGVLFKIRSGTGCFFYYCADCNKEVSRVDCDKYETLLSNCDKCGNDIFKFRITVNKDNDLQEYWKAECVKCEGSPKSVYVDNEGKIIDAEKREFLILRDRIDELEVEVEDLESEIETKSETIRQIEDEVSNLNGELEDKDNQVYDLENSLNSAKIQVSKLEDQVSDLEWEIRRLEE